MMRANTLYPPVAEDAEADLRRVGQAIRLARQGAQRTQLYIAQRSGVSPTVLSAYENGRKRPNLRTLALIAASLDMTMAELLQNNTAGRD